MRPAVIGQTARRLLRRIENRAARLKFYPETDEWCLRHKETGRLEKVRARVAIAELLRENCVAIQRRMDGVVTYRISEKGRRAIEGR